MYRISRVFERATAEVIKIAGQVTDGDLGPWGRFLESLNLETTGWVILDFCDVSQVGRGAAEILVRFLPENVLVLNCPTSLENILTSAGFSNQILEPRNVGFLRGELAFMNLQPGIENQI
jgi:hypothetical protein